MAGDRALQKVFPGKSTASATYIIDEPLLSGWLEPYLRDALASLPPFGFYPLFPILRPVSLIPIY